MNYPHFFKKLRIFIHPLIYVSAVGALAFVIWQNVKPSVSFVYNFPKMPSIHAKGPVDKFNKPYAFYTSQDESFLVISRTQAFFEITLPGEFNKISFEIVHQNQNQLELNLQVPKNSRRSSKALATEGEEFLRLPLYNNILQQAGSWNKVEGADGWILLQRPETQVLQYGSIDKFLQKPPVDRQTLTFEDISPQFEQYNEATSLNHIDYILARYDIPEQIGQWMVSSYTVDVPEELRYRSAIYKFHLEAYGPEESKSFVKAIKITLHRPSGTIRKLLEF